MMMFVEDYINFKLKIMFLLMIYWIK